MAFSAGIFSRLYSWTVDRNNNVKINAARMDAEFDGIATALSSCVLKDGTQTITADLPFNGRKITGLGLATAGADAMSQDASDARYFRATANSVANSLLAQMPALTLKGNATGSLANAADITLGSTLAFSGGTLVVNVGTASGTVAAGDDSRIAGAAQKSANLSDMVAATARSNLGLGGAAVLSVGTTVGTVMAGDDARANGAVRYDTSQSLSAGQQAQVLSNIGFPTPLTPGGRLALQTATPVISADVTGAATIFYTPHLHAYVPINTGATLLRAFTELSQALTDTTKSPAAAVANSNYDLFVWDDGGTLRLSRGPAWTSDTSRGTGAGTSEIQYAIGLWSNKFAISNGPAAGRGTYVGSIRTNASALVDFALGSTNVGGGAAILSVWNAYNRVPVGVEVIESTTSYSYTSSVKRPANNSTTCRVSFISGVALDMLAAQYRAHASSAGGSGIGLGLDSTSTSIRDSIQANINATLVVAGTFSPMLGWHYLQALEYGDNVNASTFQAAGSQAGLSARWML